MVRSAWNKGKKLSDSHKKALSKAHKGKPSGKKGKKLSDEIKRKISLTLKGRKLSEETKKKMIGRKGYWEGKKRPEFSSFKHPLYGKKRSEKTKEKISKKLNGRKLSLNTIEKLKGRRPWNYIDGRSKLLSPARYGDDWEAIRLLIYKRDNFQCKMCGITMNEYGKAMDVHHIIPFLYSGDNSLKNLITLCRNCHTKVERKIVQEQKQMKIKTEEIKMNNINGLEVGELL